MKVISYIRVSTAKQGASGLGLDSQRTSIEGWLASHPEATVIAEYCEIESGKHDNRPQLTEALRLADLTGATVLIAKLDRLSRSAEFLFHLQNSGVKFLALDLPVVNPLTLGAFAGLAQQERELISERTRKALAAKKAQGVKLGNPNGATAFGDRRGLGAGEGAKRNADAYAAKLADLLRPMKEEGLSLRAMASKLTEMGVLTRRGGKWTATGVKNILDRIG